MTVTAGPRLISALIDLLPLLFAVILASAGYHLGTTREQAAAATAFDGVFMKIVFIAGLVCAEALGEITARAVGGATLGDLLLNIRLIASDGRRATWRALATRERLRYFESTPAILNGIGHTPLRQRPADVAAGTVVVKARAAPPVGLGLLMGGLVLQVWLEGLVLSALYVAHGLMV